MTSPLVNPRVSVAADPDAGLVIANVSIAAPVERVRRALTTDERGAWWGADETAPSIEPAADLAPGDDLRAAVRHPDGSTGALTVRLRGAADDTELTLRHEGLRAAAARDHVARWASVLRRLAAHVAPPSSRSFVCRLLAPRPTFPADMTAEERALMGQHVAYWCAHLESGAAVVLGPVADPAGVWGLAVLRAADDAAARAFTDADPVVRAGRGFRYEILPMMSAVARE